MKLVNRNQSICQSNQSLAITANYSTYTNQFMLMLLLLFSISFIGITAQSSRTITGHVYDETNLPLPGVSILIKGTNNGVVSDLNGAYSLSVTIENKYLVFTYIGYESKEILIGVQKIIDVVMISENTALDEIKVVGYATVKKSVLCGSVSNVSSTKSERKKEKFSPPVIMYDQEASACYMVAPPTPEPEFNTEGYSTVHENGFREVSREPLSTFSVDVDKASYANIRRFLNEGQLPPVDAVRIEEMINYFSYQYPQPDNNEPFAVKSEMAVCPWNNQHYLLKIGLKGKEIEKTNLPPSNLVFLLDVSGSMDADNKLPLLKSAFSMLVKELRPNDKVAIVVYAGAAGLVLESTSGNQKEKILNSLSRLQAGGSTAGGAGLQLAYEIAKQNFVKGGNNRIILATDGDFNIGASSNAEMERKIETERNNGVFITVLGFGMGNYKDDKMEIIADKGNGNYAYIDNLQEAQKTLVSEFGGTLFTIAKDVKFQLEFNPSKISAYRLIGYENRLLNNEDFNNDKKDAGEIGAGHTVTALYELVPASSPDANIFEGKVDPLKYQKNIEPAANTSEWLTYKLRYKQPESDQSVLIEKSVVSTPVAFERASDDLRFASSVAAFGLLLRDSEYKAGLTFAKVEDMAKKAKGSDDDGYRGEMVRLIGIAKSLKNELAANE